MTRLVAACLLAAALAGCIQVADEDATPTAEAWRRRFDPYRFAYNATDCTLLETVVPGDWTATEARLPAGYRPVDYGDYWGEAETGDSTVSVVWWDCGRWQSEAADRAHREVFVGAYVEAPVAERGNATPFYLFDVATTNPAYAETLEALNWTPRRPDNLTVDVGLGDRVTGRVDGPTGSLVGEGAFPAGDTQTGTFAFENLHAVPGGMVRQRMAFASFSYRTAPTELTVDGDPVLTDLVGDGVTRGMGFYGWEIGYEVNLTLDRSAR